MANLKYRITSKEDMRAVVEHLKTSNPSLTILGGKLNFVNHVTRYLYLTNGVIYLGHNNYAFKSSNNIFSNYNKVETPLVEEVTFCEDCAETAVETPICNSLMLDIETLGTLPGYVVLSIGAVLFDMESGTIGEKFYGVLSVASSLEAGFRISADTLLWWSNQDKGAYYEALNPELSTPFIEVISKFRDWVRVFSYDTETLEVWGNSARFDIGLLETYFKASGLNAPWNHYNERDVRTLVKFAPHIKDKHVLDKDGNRLTTHKPVQDCLDQIKYCVEINSKIMILD